MKYLDKRRLESLKNLYILKDFFDNEYPTQARQAIFHRILGAMSITPDQAKALIAWSTSHNQISKAISQLGNPQYLQEIANIRQSLNNSSIFGDGRIRLLNEMSIHDDSIILQGNYPPAPFNTVVYRGIGHSISSPFVTIPNSHYPISTSINPKRAVIFAAGGGNASDGLVHWSTSRSSELQVIHVRQGSAILPVPHIAGNMRRQEFEILLPPKASLAFMSNLKSPLPNDQRRISLYEY